MFPVKLRGPRGSSAVQGSFRGPRTIPVSSNGHPKENNGNLSIMLDPPSLTYMSLPLFRLVSPGNHGSGAVLVVRLAIVVGKLLGSRTRQEKISKRFWRITDITIVIPSPKPPEACLKGGTWPSSSGSVHSTPPQAVWLPRRITSPAPSPPLAFTGISSQPSRNSTLPVRPRPQTHPPASPPPRCPPHSESCPDRSPSRPPRPHPSHSGARQA